VDPGFLIAIVLALVFSLTNGLHDAANAIATLVSTKVATPLQAVALAAVCNLLGPLLVGAAVADTIGSIVELPPAETVAAIGSGLIAAVTWNVITWRFGLPSSSGHALVGGLVGAAAVVGGASAVNWGGFDGWKPVGVVGTLVALAISPFLGFSVAAVGDRLLRRAATRMTRRWARPIDLGQWVTSGALAFSHGANDAQKAVGVIAALLLAEGHVDELDAPTWAALASALALTVGTAFGGWTIVRTIGERIIRVRRIDGMVTQGASAGVISAASLAGAPVSTTQVVASSVVGIGGGRRRWRHVHWAVVRHMGLAWLITLPATAAIAAVTVVVWRSL
jgi:PiT family inorganic phosphate transporter